MSETGHVQLQESVRVAHVAYVVQKLANAPLYSLDCFDVFFSVRIPGWSCVLEVRAGKGRKELFKRVGVPRFEPSFRFVDADT